MVMKTYDETSKREVREYIKVYKGASSADLQKIKWIMVGMKIAGEVKDDDKEKGANNGCSV